MKNQLSTNHTSGTGNRTGTHLRLKEAALYVQQGLYSDAAAIYRGLIDQCCERYEKDQKLSAQDQSAIRKIVASLEKRLDYVEDCVANQKNDSQDMITMNAGLSGESLYNRGIRLNSVGFYFEGINELERAMMKNPALSGQCLEAIAEARIALGKREVGIRILQKALLLAKGNAEKEEALQMRIAGLLEESGEYPQTRVILRPGTQKQPLILRIFGKVVKLFREYATTQFDFGIISRYPIWFFAGGLILAFAFILFNPLAHTISNVDYLTLEKHPDFEFHETLKSEFGRDNFFVVAFRSDDLFTHQNLEMLRHITTSLEVLDGVYKVTSLANAKMISGGKNHFNVWPYMDGIPETKEDLEKLKQKALQNTLFLNNLISSDGCTAAIVVEPEPRSIREDTKRNVLNATEAILAPYKAKGVQFYIAGRDTINHKLSQYLNSEMQLFLPVACLMIVLSTWFFMGNIKFSFLVLINILICVGTIRGLMGLWAIPISEITIIIFPFVMALSLCGSVELLSQMNQQSRKQFFRLDLALAHVLNKNGRVCFWGALASAVGFLSLTFSNIAPIKQFGVVAATGIVFEFIFTFSLLPPMILFLNSKKVYTAQANEKRIGTFLVQLFSFVSKSYSAMIILASVLILAASVGTVMLRIESNPIELLKKNNAARASLGFVERHLSGVATLDVSFKAKESGAFKIIENLQVIETIQKHIDTLAHVDKTTSIVNYFKEMNRAFFNGDPAAFQLPDSNASISQLFAMYSANDIKQFINSDFSHARISIRLSQHSSGEIKKFYQTLHNYLEHVDSKGISIRITGQSLKDALILDTLVRSQIYGLALATLIICFILYVVFRSAAMAGLGLISIIFTLLTITGVMGGMGLPVDTATAFVAAVSLCVTMRFAIHFLSEYQNRWTQGLLTSKAIKYSLLTKGPSIMMTGFILAAGFLGMAMSQWGALVHFGFLCALSMLSALVASLVFIPAVILLNKDKLDSDDPMV